MFRNTCLYTDTVDLNAGVLKVISERCVCMVLDDEGNVEASTR